MRTYTRKKIGHQLIEGVLDLCRLCLQKTNCSSVSLFKHDTDSKIYVALPVRIMFCVGLELSYNEYLPNKICLDCYKELERCYAFRKKCEMAYQRLRSHLLAVKLEKPLENGQSLLKSSNNKEIHEKGVQHLVLKCNEKKEVEVVDVVNLHCAQLPDGSLVNADRTPVDPERPNMDMMMILSTILSELGVLQQTDNGCVELDETLTTVEIEGEDNTKVTLELVEEDEEEITVEEITKCQEKITTSKKTTELPNNNEANKSLSRTCMKCGKTFASRSMLTRHSRVHSGERPFACGVATCGRRFSQREVRNRHQLVHQERRPFQCASCPKSFTQRGALAGHARAHHAPHARPLRLHRCPVCDKLFLHASGLSRHMTVHSGILFTCDTCGRSFKDKSSLRRHLKRAHPEKKD